MNEPIEIRIYITIQPNGQIYYSQLGKRGIGTEIPNTFIPNMKFKCLRWSKQINKKQPKSCKGCTIQCHMKGKYKGKEININKGFKMINPAIPPSRDPEENIPDGDGWTDKDEDPSNEDE